MTNFQNIFLIFFHPDFDSFTGDTWHLRKMDWCYEAGEPLCEEVRLFLHILFLETICVFCVSYRIPTFAPLVNKF